MRVNKPFYLALLGMWILLITVPSSACDHASLHERWNYALIRAIRANDTPAAMAALKAGADPNTLAYYWEDVEQLPFELERFLSLHDPEANTKWDSRYSALLLHLQVSYIIYVHDPIAHMDYEEDTALVKALLEAGADPNHHGYQDERFAGPGNITPIHSAIETYRPRILRLLLEHGGNVGERYLHGDTPLHLAAGSGVIRLVQILLDYGADANSMTYPRYSDTPSPDYNLTPLHVACNAKSLDIIQLLLNHHADINVRRGNGPTPLDAALKPPIGDLVITTHNDPRDAETEAMHKKVVPFLQKAGAKTGEELNHETSGK
ncbi:MAG TPA: ankyrin repeat domain-containing protein [Chthonomonadaceae bacterium]|nr:ankyrin repeat domain-containing protein [Chthonomonadaceae bacterium]